MLKNVILLYTKIFKNQGARGYFFNFFLFIFGASKNDKYIFVNCLKIKEL